MYWEGFGEAIYIIYEPSDIRKISSNHSDTGLLCQ